MNKITPILILSLILSIVAFSGCTTDVQNKTYSKNGFNLTYPGDMKDNATFIWINAPNSTDKIDTLGNDKLVISIQYNELSKAEVSALSYITFNQWKDAVWAAFSESNDTKTTQVYSADKSKNGTAIFEEIYTSKDPIKGTELKNKRVILFDDKTHTHIIIFQTKATDFESQIDTMNAIQNSIVLT